MNISGKRIKCVSNLHAPELVVGKVYTASEVRTNTHGVWQVEVNGKWYAQNRFELAKEEEMKQQFYVGDVVEVVETKAENWYKVGDKFVVSGWNDGKDALSSEPPHVTIEGEGKGVWVLAKDLKILSRAWQKNTGIMPVSGDIEVEIKLRVCGTDKAPAAQYRWDFEDSSGDIVEWRLADSVSSVEEQPKDSVPPSHVAVGEELVATNVQQDLVNSPKHYAFFDGVEAIEIIASSLSVEAFRGYCMGNALKYRLRVGKKDKVEQEIAKADKYGELFEKHKHLCKGEK